MAVNFTAANNAVSAQPQDIIFSAMLEMGGIAFGDPLPGEKASWGLEKLQRLIDAFNAQESVIFSHNFVQYSITPNHAPHTFGPTGDFNVPVRPVKVISAAVILNSGFSAVDLPINIRDDQWWRDNPLKSMVGSITTDLYYDAASPLGNCNFWPVSSVANPVRLETWNSLAQPINLTTPLGFVQGYWDAIVLSLAVSLCPSFEREPSATLVAMQRNAMRIIIGNNSAPPRIDTNAGMPTSGKGGRPDFNFLTGLRE